jgi:hypothetical protein
VRKLRAAYLYRDMRRHSRELIFDRIEPGNELSGRCSVCRQRLVVLAGREDRMDNLILRLRDEFAKHDCYGIDPGGLINKPQR